MSGGKGGTTTSKVEIPEYLEDASKRNLEKADQISRLGYVPYYGPDVASFNPTQESAFQNTNDMAGAFGTNVPTSSTARMPEAQTFAGGIQGYSSAPMFEESLATLEANRPGQYNAMTEMFIDPQTGLMPGVDPNSVMREGEFGFDPNSVMREGEFGVDQMLADLDANIAKAEVETREERTRRRNREKFKKRHNDFHNNRKSGQSNAYTTNGISDMHGSGFTPGSVIGGPNSSISFQNPLKGLLGR